MRSAVLALALAALIGCQKNEPASAPAPGQPAPQPGAPKGGNPPVDQPVTPPTDEDPEVLAHFKAKGWRLNYDSQVTGGKARVHLNIDDGKTIGLPLAPDDCKMIAKLKRVQVLDLSHMKCDAAGLKLVASNPRLEGILLGGESVTDAGLKELAACKTLESVMLLDVKNVTDVGIRELAALPKLRTLHASFLKLNGSALEAFAGAKALTALTLDYADGLTDAGLKHIAKLPNLNELKIKGGFDQTYTSAGIRAIADARLPAKFEFDAEVMDDDAFAALVAKGWLYGPSSPGASEPRPATAADVKSISLSRSKVTDKGFAAVLNCTNITALHLDSTGVTDESLRKLSAFTKLEHLALEKTKATGAGLAALAGGSLKHVNLKHCALDEAAFKALGQMRALEELWLSETQMQADWLKHLAGLPKLRDLNMREAALDDAAVKHLLALPALTELNASDTNLGDAGFQQLQAHPVLEKLFVDGTKVTKEVYLKAKKDYPKRSFFSSRYDN